MPITRMCWARSAAIAVEIQLQKVRRTGDARVVIADRLLTAPGERFIGQVEVGGENPAQVVLDASLVLRGGWYNKRGQDRSVLRNFVAVIEHAARRFRRPTTNARPWHDIDSLSIRLLVILDKSQRLVAGMHDFDAANDNALERVQTDSLELGFARGLLSDLRQSIVVESVAGERTHQIRIPVFDPGVERRGVDHLVLPKACLEGVERQVETAAGNDPALVERIPLLVA